MAIAKPRILCVDDEPVNLKIFNDILLPQGYEVLYAQNGRQALEMIIKLKIDLVLLDTMMPEMNGYEVCRQIKENINQVDIPMVMITGLQVKKEKIKGIEAGADDYISKPVDQDEILARIKMLLKTKESNDRLSQAYNNFAVLATFGEETVRTFDPLTFELLPNIDGLISKVIRQNNAMIFQPQGFIVGIQEEKGWKFYYYESSSQELHRRQFELDIQKLLSLPARGSSRVVIAERSEFADKGLKSFTIQLETQPMLKVAIENIFCFLSGDLCVFALNYGREVTAYEASISNNLAMQIMFFKSLADQVKRAEGTFVHSIRSLIRASEIHDMDTGNHNLRVGEYCALLARHLHMPENIVRTISQQAQMHDVGNIYIAGEILTKRSSPTFEEWNIIRKHTLFGAEILNNNPYLSMARTIALSHHENWNGSGYPHLLKGEQIPTVARIASLADRYDALRNPRPYKAAWDHKTAFEKIIGGDNRIQPEFFDPQVMKVFKELASQFEAIYEKFKG